MKNIHIIQVDSIDTGVVTLDSAWTDIRKAEKRLKLLKEENERDIREFKEKNPGYSIEGDVIEIITLPISTN